MPFSLRSAGMLAACALALAIALVALDRLVDPGPVSAGEIALDLAETLILVGAMFVSASVVLRVAAVERDGARLSREIAHARAEGEGWRRRSARLLQGLSEAIGAQFDAWGLTPAERDVAALLLKGLALRDIAALRATSEATIRQQAQGVYRKSGLANRAELSAYFLEDLFCVAEDTAAPPAPLN